MPASARTEIDRLSRNLIQTMRGQSDARINRNVHNVETGVVLSLDPLQIMVNSNLSTPIVLGAGEVGVLPTEAISQGQTVIIIKTPNGQSVAMPVVPGYDLQPLTGSTGTNSPSSGGDPTVVQNEPAIGGPAGDRVINLALSYVGKKETGYNTDGGGKIDEWITKSGGSIGQPWCGYFAMSMYRESGVDDSGLANGYCPTIISKAQSQNMTRSQPVKGCMSVNPGHVTLYISGPINAATTVGGNQSDGVTTGVRNLTGDVFCVPASLVAGATTSNPGTGANANNQTPAQRAARNNAPPIYNT